VGVAGELHGQQVGPGIEPDDKLRPLALDGLRQPVAERGLGDAVGRFEILRHRLLNLALGSEMTRAA
jgi:hypothetical protein